MIEQIPNTVMETGVAHIIKKVASFVGASRPPVITKVRMADVLPRRVVLAHTFTPEELLHMSYPEIHDARFDNDGMPFGWVNCAELAFRLENPSADTMIEVIGFHIDREDLDVVAQASFLDISQGDYGGEAWRFACPLTHAGAVRQRYEVVDHMVHFMGERDYFELSTLQLAPAGHENVCLTLISNDRARVVKGVEIVYETRDGAECVAVPLPGVIRVFPLSNVPEAQRLRRSWQTRPPYAVAESDASLIPADTRKCPWDDFA